MQSVEKLYFASTAFSSWYQPQTMHWVEKDCIVLKKKHKMLLPTDGSIYQQYVTTYYSVHIYVYVVRIYNGNAYLYYVVFYRSLWQRVSLFSKHFSTKCGYYFGIKRGRQGIAIRIPQYFRLYFALYSMVICR